MSLKNRYADVTYSAEAVQGFDTAITTASTQFTTLPTADTSAVDRLAKMGQKNGSFSREALDLAKLHADLLPAAFDVNRMQKTIDNRDLLLTRLAQLDLLRERIHTAIVLHGVDAYSDGLTVYSALRRFGTDLSLREAVTHLGRIFKRAPRPDDGPDTPTTPPPSTNP